MMTVEAIRNELKSRKDRSAWDKGVTLYAIDLLEDYSGECAFPGHPDDARALMNGADNWHQYSEGGCALVYDGDIAERLCCPSELKRTRNGERNPNGNETWLDVQARALHQACARIMRIARR